MNYPYIYTTPRVPIRQAHDFDNERGVVYREIEGEHAIWAARVPFLPAMLSDDFTRYGKQRIPLIQQRQFRFIYDLARARENGATFELRFIATPNPVAGQPSLIDIVFLGKVYASRAHGGQALAERLWEKFQSNFPLEDPFNYPIEPVTDKEDFWRCYQPIPLEEVEARNLLEIRKYEDMPIRSTAKLGRVERKGDYIAHPFVPSVDFSPMGRFFAALAVQDQKCYAGISLRPTRMFDQEVYNVSFAIGMFKRQAGEDDDVTEEYIRARSEIGIYVYESLMQEREQLVMVRVHVVGEHEAPLGLAEALGSEMMGNVSSKYPTQWVSARPADESELGVAAGNLRYLEHDIWGYSIAAPPLARLRYLATATEAYGAFRLPAPPESGYMPGVLVKNEPFVALPEELELRRLARANLNDMHRETMQQAQEKKIDLGAVYHRGNLTSQPFTINLRDLTRHTLIGGSTGSGKSTTIKHILAQLWIQHKAPFLVLYPIDKNDYRELRGFNGLRDDLLVFTLGDESTSPFRFNPFEVPDGLLLKTHLSRLMRVFMAAFTLQDPLPMIYRDALRRVYRKKGWDTVSGRGEGERREGERREGGRREGGRREGERREGGREYPIMSEFFAEIKEIADKLEYGREVKDNVRQASVIRIADLLENAGHVVNVRRSMSLGTILNQPTVMEIGRVGSVQDTSLLMGFLLMRFAEEVERNPRPADHPHITVVEEAHRLMAETGPSLAGVGGDARGSAGEDFANILAEVRGYGEGLIIAEQIPTLLVKGAIGNTYNKIMHWLEDAPSFELFGSIMNLVPQQREYARTLTPGFAIVRSPSGRPVHIKVPEFGDQAGFDKAEAKRISDDLLRAEMLAQRRRCGLEDVPVIAWEAALAVEAQGPKGQADAQARAAADGWRAPAATLGWLLGIPMQTCLFCKPLHQTLGCPYGPAVRAKLVNQSVLLAADLVAAAAASDSSEERRVKITELGWKLQGVLGGLPANSIIAGLSSEQRKDVLYCYLAHEADRLRRDADFSARKNQRDNLRSLLAGFHSQVKP